MTFRVSIASRFSPDLERARQGVDPSAESRSTSREHPAQARSRRACPETAADDAAVIACLKYLLAAPFSKRNLLGGDLAPTQGDSSRRCRPNTGRTARRLEPHTALLRIANRALPAPARGTQQTNQRFFNLVRRWSTLAFLPWPDQVQVV
jgi:hypothetical protein